MSLQITMNSYCNVIRVCVLLAFFMLTGITVFAQFKSPPPTSIINLGDSVNTKYDELSPLITPDGSRLYYTRKNHPYNTFIRRKFSDCVDIFYSKANGQNDWRNGRHMTNPFNQRIFNSIESISADGKIVYIRGAYKNGNYKGNGISVVYEDLGRWTAPERLRIKAFKRLNKGATSNFCMAGAGKVLLMSFSKTEGGKTNDLFVSFLQEDGKWSKPEELLYPANTKRGSEEIPFLASDNETMYFSSDREGSYGLNDLWVTRRLDDTWLNWSEPLVIDTPINSKNWEGYCSTDAEGEYIYFVSNNNTINGSSDVVKAKLDEKFRPKPVAMLEGRVLDSKKQPLNTLIRFIDARTNNEYARTRSSGLDGSYKIALPLGRNFFVETELVDYIPMAEGVEMNGLNPLNGLSSKNITAYSIDELKALTGLKEAELRGAGLVRKAGGLFDLVLSDGGKRSIVLKDDEGLKSATVEVPVVFTYFIPVAYLVGIDSAEIAALHEQPYIDRTDNKDGSVTIKLQSGKQFQLIPKKGGYQLIPLNSKVKRIKKELSKIYTDIYKVPVNRIEGLDIAEQELLMDKAVITNFSPEIEQQVFTPTNLGIAYMVLKGPRNSVSILPVNSSKSYNGLFANADTLNYQPYLDISGLGDMPLGLDIAVEGSFYLVPLEAFNLSTEELAALRANPTIEQEELSDKSVRITLPSGKKFIIKSASKGQEGYVLYPEGESARGVPPNKNILKVPLGGLRGLPQQEKEVLRGGVFLSELNKENNKYEFTSPSGKKFQVAAITDGFISITSLSGYSDALTLAGLDRNFYLGSLAIGETVLIDNLFFDFAKAHIRPESARSLNKLYDLLAASPKTEIMIVGHTDNIGNKQFNVKLSYQRTESVKQYLINKGIAADRIKVYGYGPNKPLTSNKNEADRQINRRVEFTIMKN